MSDYQIDLSTQRVQRWRFDGDVLSLDDMVPVQVRDVTEMNLRRGLDNEIELLTPGGVTRISGPKSGQPGPSAVWMALARDLIAALPGEAALVFRPTRRMSLVGSVAVLTSLVGIATVLVIAGIDLGSLSLSALLLAGGLFLGWAFAAFSGTRSLERRQTADALDRVTVILERLGHVSPGAGVTRNARKTVFKALGRVSDWPLEPDDGKPWPVEEAYRVIWTEKESVLVVTDGLTSRYDDGREGLSFELAMELPEVKEIEDLIGTTEFELFRQLADKALARELNEHGNSVIDLPCGDPSYCREGSAGLLVGTADAGPDGWRILPVLLLLPDELARLRTEGDMAKDEFLAALPEGDSVSRPDRGPLT